MKTTIAYAVGLASALLGTSVNAQTLYAIDDNSRNLITIDRTTGAISVVGATGVAAGLFGDLAYDPGAGVAYWVAGRNNDSLYTVNLATGGATLVGSHGIGDMFGLAYDTATGQLFGTSTFSGAVYTLNTSTGAATSVGPSAQYPGGLDYIAGTNTIIGFGAGGGNFYSVDPITGASSPISAGVGFINDGDLAYDVGANVTYVADYSGNFFRYNSALNGRVTVASGLGPIASLILVGQGPRIPEPATWAMMILGFGLTGAGVRARARTRITCA